MKNNFFFKRPTGTSIAASIGVRDVCKVIAQTCMHPYCLVLSLTLIHHHFPFKNTSIDDPGLGSDSAVDIVREPLAEVGVHLLCLLGCGHSTCTDGPDWLIGYHHFVPISDVVWR